jgi:3-hydroxybutyrate dehydrogenase
MKAKTALVTGSTSGIGLAIARKLAEEGVQVMLNGLEPEGVGRQLSDSIESDYGVKARYCHADLSDPQKIEQLFQCMMDEFKTINLLINNAGIQFTAPADEFPSDKWDQILAVNLTSAFHTTRLALPHFKKAGWGRIVNIASVHGLVGSVNKSAYCAAKHGLVGFTKVVALENADAGITANCICPGWTDTPILNDQVAKLAQQQEISTERATAELVQSKQPYPKLINPSAIAELVVFLCSDAASALTGASIPIDGAWTAQ